jgi:hypothetical protein
VNFVNHVIINSSFEEMTKIRFVDLHELFNVGIHNFFNRSLLVS